MSIQSSGDLRLPRDGPEPVPSLPGDLADEAFVGHPSEVALDGGAAGADLGFGHRRRNQRPIP